MVSRLVGGAAHISSSADARHHEMGPWATYTPSWTSSGTQPSLGNGTLVGGYRRNGTTLHCRGELRVGSTSSVGSGDLRISLPSGITTIAAQFQTMAGFWYDASTAIVSRGIAIAESTQTYLTFQMADVGARSGTGGLGNGDWINWTGTIEVDF